MPLPIKFPSFIYGIHDPGNWMDRVQSTGRQGWVLYTDEVRENTSGNNNTAMGTRALSTSQTALLVAIPIVVGAVGRILLLLTILYLASALFGWVRGGLAHVTIVAEMFFSGISGSAVADAAALSAVLSPSMAKQYDEDFGNGIVASAAMLGPIIPPSIPMIVYGMAANESAGDLSAFSFHMADEGTDTNQREKAFLLASEDGRRIMAIDAALRRLYRDRAAFGKCSNCGGDVGFDRLEAIPWAETCIACQNQRENGA